MNVERNVMPVHGAKFFLSDDDEEMFEFVIDGSNKVGPRKATDDDRDKHPDAHNQFLAEATALPGEEPESSNDKPSHPKRRGRPPRAAKG